MLRRRRSYAIDLKLGDLEPVDHVLDTLETRCPPSFLSSAILTNLTSHPLEVNRTEEGGVNDRKT